MSLDVAQCGGQELDRRAVLLRPVGQQRVDGVFATAKHVHSVLLVTQDGGQLPPAPTSTLGQKLLHLLLPVRGQRKVARVLLGVLLNACKKKCWLSVSYPAWTYQW